LDILLSRSELLKLWVRYFESSNSLSTLTWSNTIGQTRWLDDIARQALLFSACVILTTIQAQDFSDVVGDAQIGRVTFPIYAPSFSRVFTLFVIVLWSAILSMHWSLGLYWQIAFCSLGAYVGWRYYRLRTSAQDSRSYLLFNVSVFLFLSYPSEPHRKHRYGYLWYICCLLAHAGAFLQLDKTCERIQNLKDFVRKPLLGLVIVNK
jgi:hypothetical protein